MLRNNFIPILCGLLLSISLDAWGYESRLLDVTSHGELILEGTEPAILEAMLLPDAKAAVDYIAQHKNSMLHYSVVDTDRYGRPHIIAYTEKNEASLQQQLLQQGLAIVYSTQSLKNIDNWMKDEAIGRSQKAGFWSHANSIISEVNASDYINKFVIAQALATSIYRGTDAYYINFGARWQDDFSVKIPRKSWRDMQTWIEEFEAKLAVTNNTDSKRLIVDKKHTILLRIRGVVVQENGPMIMVTQPHQLEVVAIH